MIQLWFFFKILKYKYQLFIEYDSLSDKLFSQDKSGVFFIDWMVSYFGLLKRSKDDMIIKKLPIMQ